MNAPQPKFYASLTGPMLGIYFPMPAELNKAQCRAALNTSKLANIWCAVYSRQEVTEQVGKYGGLLLDDSFAAKLDYDSHVVDGWAEVRS